MQKGRTAGAEDAPRLGFAIGIAVLCSLFAARAATPFQAAETPDAAGVSHVLGRRLMLPGKCMRTYVRVR